MSHAEGKTSRNVLLDSTFLVRNSPLNCGFAVFRGVHERVRIMDKKYVVQKDEGFWVGDTRVSLDSIIYAFLSGQTAESIAQSFPVLTLEQVYGAIAFYLANRGRVDAHLAKTESEYEDMRRVSRESDPMFYQKFPEAIRHKKVIGQ